MASPVPSGVNGDRSREPALRCTIKNCPEAAERTFTSRIGRIKVVVPLCAHHVKVAFAADEREHHPLPTTTVRMSPAPESTRDRGADRSPRPGSRSRV